MLKFVLSAIICFLFIFQVNAQTTISKPLLFEIEKNGNKAYLLGTIHTGIGYSSLPSYVADKVTISTTIIIESDLDAAQAIISNKFPIPSTTSLKSLLTDSEWSTLLTKLSPLGITADTLDTFPPIIAASLYTLVQLPQVADPMDSHLVEIAKQSGKSIDFLETAESAVDVLAIILDINSLKTTLNTSETDIVTAANSVVSAYLSGDEELLLTTMKSDKTLNETSFNLLIDNRNKAWISEFNRIIENNGVEFFAFGAGHLGGTNGVLALLKSQGYSVVRVTK